MKSIALTLVALVGVFILNAQKKERMEKVRVENTQAIYLGTVSPDLDNQYRLTSKKKKDSKRVVKQLPPNFIGRGKSKVVRPELEHQGPDPLRQSQLSRRSGANTVVDPMVNIDGQSLLGSPHDPTGSIGLDHYLQAINVTRIGVYDKEGNLETSFAASSLWTPLGESSLGDPIVLYAHESDQWIITEFSDPAILLIAVSETSDPLGDYHVYSFATPQFPDYPKYAIWDDFLVVTTNESGPSVLHQYFLDKNALLAGAAEVTIQRVAIDGSPNTEAGFYVTTPVHWNGATLPVDNNPIAVKINDSSWGEVENDVMEVFSFDVDLANPENTVVTRTQLVTTPFDSYPCDNESGGFACVSQGEGAGGLDAIPEVVMNIPHYRNFGTHESIVLNFVTDVTDGNNLAGIRWMELRRTSGTDWEVYQEGTFSPDDGLHRYMGSIAMDETGNIGLAYAVSGPTTFAGLRFTGRFADDPLGEMTVQEAVIVDGTNSIGTDRFGDYAHMTVDPVDGQTFWFTAEYGGDVNNGNSLTRIVSFQLEKKDNDLALAGISSPVTSGSLGATEEVIATVQNTGNLDATNFDLTLMLDDQLIETFTYDQTLVTGASYEHTFATSIDLSAIGSYQIEVSVDYPLDESSGNDLREKTVRKLASNDAALVLSLDSETCTGATIGELLLTNEGANTITSVNIETFVGDQSIETINWTGSLETGESETIAVGYTGLVSGENTLVAEILNVNESADEVLTDNRSEAIITFASDLEQVSLVLTTDNFPQETLWALQDATGDVLFSGGPYNAVDTFTENFCLPSDQCYIFTIVDIEEDGICCDFGQGSYEILDAQGNAIFSSSGQFGFSEQAAICIGDPPQNNAAVFLTGADETYCTTNLITQVEIKNLGQQPLTTLDLEVEVNGTVTDNFNWTGNLNLSESDYFTFNYLGLGEGQNNVVVRTSNPNGVADDGLDSNRDSGTITVASDPNSENLSLIIQFDDFPEETQWELVNGNQEVIVSGGPYVNVFGQVLESICVPKDGCYELTFLDAFGDGICCDFGQGRYELLNEVGDVIFNSNGQFASAETNAFCLGEECNLAIEIAKTDVKGNEQGTLMIQASGGLTYQYSINGGFTFSASSTYSNLSAGFYDIVVKDDANCIVRETVEIIEIPLGVSDLGDQLMISPNPTKGLFNISMDVIPQIEGYLMIQVYDINGRLIQERKFGRYDDKFRGQVSLYGYPDGVYLLKPVNTASQKLYRVIKKI